MLSRTRHRIIKAALFLLVALCALSVPRLIMQRTLRAQYERHARLSADIHVLAAELDRYKTVNGHYPTTEQGLQVVAAVPKDPWGRDYIYRSPGIPHRDPYDVFSAGPDGKANTADDDWGDP